MRLSFGAIVLSVLLLVGCGGCPAPVRKTAFIVLFDVSGSTQGTMRQRYFDDFQKVLDSCTGGDMLICDILTENTVATATFPIRETFPVYDSLLDNPLTYKKKNQRLRTLILEKARKILFTPTSRESDLLSGPLLIDKVCHGTMTQGCANKKAIIFTDGVQQTKACDFLKEHLDENRTAQLIQQERDKGHVPNLQGVDVWMAGAGAVNLERFKLDQIQNFWLSYFKVCNATFPAERYNTTLMNFGISQAGTVGSGTLVPPDANASQRAIPPSGPASNGRDNIADIASFNAGPNANPKALDTAALKSGDTGPKLIGYLVATSNGRKATLYYSDEAGVKKIIRFNNDLDMVPLAAGRYQVEVKSETGKIITRERNIIVGEGETSIIGPDN